MHYELTFRIGHWSPIYMYTEMRNKPCTNLTFPPSGEAYHCTVCPSAILAKIGGMLGTAYRPYL